MTDVVELAARLVELESVNPDLGSGGSGETAVARYVAEWCERAGPDVTLADAAPGRPNVLALARGRGGGRSLMLNAHTDTVGVEGMSDPFVPRLDGGRLYGRGAYDMKGALAAAMVAVAAAARASLRGDVVLAAVADEEVASVGTSAVVAGSSLPDAAIVAEPTELQVAVAHRGFVHLAVETRGRAAHGSRPDLGVDAIAKMGRVLVGLDDLDRALRSDPTHPYLASGSLHASLISGGQEYSTYPARCTLEVERRTIPGETAATVEEELHAILRRAASCDPAFAADVRVVAHRDPFEAAAGSELAASVRRQAAEVVGVEPELVGVPYWADSALLAAAGVSTVLFGPRGAGAHAEVEWVEAADLERCASVYLAVANELCA